jgi:hypothetical protein
MATLKEITHDSSTTLSDFYTTGIINPGGVVSVTPAAALGGSVNGVSRDFDAGTGAAVLDERSFSSSTELRFRARIDISNSVNSNSGQSQVVYLTIGEGVGFFTLYAFLLDANAGDSGFTIRFQYWSDVTGLTELTNVAMPSGDTCLELRAVSETAPGANDGQVEAYINGVSQASLSDVQNEALGFDVDGIRVVCRGSANLSGTVEYDELIITDIPGVSLCLPALSLAPMTKPADVDAAGEFIYLALLEGGTPILTKISTALDADGTTVFSPGAGDNIGVECGRFNSDVVWVAGQFDGTNVVEKSEDGGSSFSVADDATIGGVKSFVMGPDNDNRILVFDEDNGDILETNDGGTTWTSINASVTPEINSIARLGKNVQESVFGNDGGVSNSINYSINSGDDLENFQTGVYPNANATKVIVN